MGLDERILDSAETATPRTRTRMYGGVGGEERRLSPYADFRKTNGWIRCTSGDDLPPIRWSNSIGAELATPLKPL
jgi:hypothetical protein